MPQLQLWPAQSWRQFEWLSGMVLDNCQLEGQDVAWKSDFSGDFPGGVIKTPGFHCRGTHVQSLARELRPYKSYDMTQKIKNKIFKLNKKEWQGEWLSRCSFSSSSLTFSTLWLYKVLPYTLFHLLLIASLCIWAFSYSWGLGKAGLMVRKGDP